MHSYNDNIILRFFDGISLRKFLGIVILYQLVFIFQGLDFADEGFHATFYEQIFNDPASVQYNFMFWFSGIIGGLWTKVFGFAGLLGIRLGGVVVITCTIGLTYNLLKNYLDNGSLKLGLFLVLLLNSNDPKEIYYNNISALLYVLICFFIFKGLRDSKNWYLFFAGFAIAFNTFARLPNLSELGLVSAIVFYGIINQRSIVFQLKQIAVFFLGFIASLALILLIMQTSGHLQLFLNAFKTMLQMGKGAGAVQAAVAADNSKYYGFKNQVALFLNSNFIALKYFAYTMLAIIVIATSRQFVYKIIKNHRVRLLLLLALFISIAFVVLQGSKLNNTPNVVILYFSLALDIMAACYIIFSDKPKELKLLAFAGLYINLTFPVGSSDGLLTAGIYAFWISFPIAIAQLFKFDSFSFNLSWLESKQAKRNLFPIGLDSGQFNLVRNWVVSFCIIGSLYSAYYYPMCNSSERIRMTYSINSSKAVAVFTNKERATAVNELLQASALYVKEGDYVLAFDAIPMYHYLTSTRPFLKNSYPWLYPIPVLKDRLDETVQSAEKKPVIVMQRIVTNGWRGRNWPENDQEVYKTWNFERNKIIEEYIAVNGYKEVWGNHAFRILIPPAHIE